MKNGLVAILDFGSSKITCMVASKVSDNGEFIIKAVGQSAYNGFDENSWYEPDTIAGAISGAIAKAEEKADIRIKEIYVGVPGAFSATATSEASVTFLSKKKVDGSDVSELIKKADIFGDKVDGICIGTEPVYYIIDGAIRTFDPVGSIANKLTALVSFTFMKNYFERTVSKALSDIGINKVEYLGVCRCQAAYIGSTMSENGYVIVVDVGHITSTVSLCCGRELLFARTFALGSGYLANDIYQVLNCDYAYAMRLLEKMNLNLEFGENDAYTVDGKAVNAAKANDVVKERIRQIAEYVIRSFDYCDKEIPRSTPIVLTGGGLTYLRGGADCLANSLGKPVKVYDSVSPQLRRNEYTSCYGLIAEAIRRNKPKGGLFAFFRKNK